MKENPLWKRLLILAALALFAASAGAIYGECECVGSNRECDWYRDDGSFIGSSTSYDDSRCAPEN